MDNRTIKLSDLPRYLRDEKLLRKLRTQDAQLEIEGHTGPLLQSIHYKQGDPKVFKTTAEATYDLMLASGQEDNKPPS